MRVIKLKRESGNIKKKRGSLRKRATPTDRYLKWLCQQNRHASAPHLKIELENTCDINTVRCSGMGMWGEMGSLLIFELQKKKKIKK